MAAVGLHNRFALPPHTPQRVALVTNVVRDADKLDILRVMDEQLSAPGPYNPTVVLQQPDDPTIASETVMRAVREGRVASYADLRCVNDFRLLLGTWFFDLHFAASRKKFLEDGHAENMTLIQDTLDNISLQGQTPPDLENLPLTDVETYELYARGDTDGVFQVESSGMRATPRATICCSSPVNSRQARPERRRFSRTLR